MEMVFLKYKDDGNARSTQVKHRQQNALNHKAQNGSERNSRNQQICPPTLYLRALRTHAMYISVSTLKTSADDKILEKPRVTGNTKIIQPCAQYDLMMMMKTCLNNN
jgi:hypothetical protein